jgi:hypothetical protein
MNYELIFKEEADREVIEGYIWYEKQQPGLGEFFLEEVEKYLNIIKKNSPLYTISTKIKEQRYYDDSPISLCMNRSKTK